MSVCFDVATRCATNLFDVRKPERLMIVEFWTTRCVRCPMALQTLNEMAASMGTEVTIASCALATSVQEEEELAKVHALVEEEEAFPHIHHHLFMNWAQKEEAKKSFGFAAVPHAVIFDSHGSQVHSGPLPERSVLYRLLGQFDADRVGANAGA